MLALRGSNGVAKEWAMVPLWLRSRCACCSNTVNYNTNAMSPSTTHHKINILIEMLQKSTGFTIENQLFLLRFLAAASWTPCHQIHPFWYGRARMVFGHNLQHMAPFGVPTTVFCMVFRHATLVFSTPGTIFGTLDSRFGPRRVPAGPGTFLV